jgi:6-phosphofructokinase
MKLQDQEMMEATRLAVVLKQAVEAAEQVLVAGGDGSVETQLWLTQKLAEEFQVKCVRITSVMLRERWKDPDVTKNIVAINSRG